MAEDYLVLIANLLAQADGTDNEHEKTAFAAAAQRIATANSVDIAAARYLNRKKGQPSTPLQKGVTIGVSGTEGLKTLVNLYLNIARANDIRCLIAHNSTYVTAIGFPEDIDASKALYASLLTQMTDLVTQYRTEGNWKGEKVWTEVWKNGYSDGGAYRNINWRTARLNFQQGFGNRIGSRLQEARREALAERAAQEAEDAKKKIFDPRYVAGVNPVDDAMTDEEWFDTYGPVPEAGDTTAPGTALILASKAEQLKEYYDTKVMKGRGVWNGGVSVHSRGASNAGRSAADRASLSGGRPLSGQRGSIER